MSANDLEYRISLFIIFQIIDKIVEDRLLLTRVKNVSTSTSHMEKCHLI